MLTQLLSFVSPESSKNLSLERAREYDRVSEWLAKNRKGSIGSKDDPLDQVQKATIAHGIEGRRHHFQKDSYRQPVLTRKPMHPRNYRRGQPDAEAEFCTRRLKELQEQNLSGTESGTLNEESTKTETSFV